MKEPDIRRLIYLAGQGDKATLAELVEWAEREAFRQELAQAPAWMRERALRALDALDKQQRAKANRRAAAIKTNKERALQPKVAELAARIANTQVMPQKKVAEALLHYIALKGPSECGLPREPCLETAQRAIRPK